MADTIIGNDNRSSREKVNDPDLGYIETALKALVAEFEGRARTTDMFELLTNALLRLVKSNPYRRPGDTGALKADLWMLYGLDARLSFLVRDYERAVELSEQPDAPPPSDDLRDDQTGGSSS